MLTTPQIAPGESPADAGSARDRSLEAWQPRLLDRAAEIELLEATVRRAAARTGGVVVLEGASGLGTTALLDHAARDAAAAGCAIRRAPLTPLDRDHDGRVLRTLLEAPARDASDVLQQRLRHGPAAAAAAWLLDGAAPAGGRVAVARGLFWLVDALAEEAPLVLLVDDAHWADRGSLALLCGLAQRVEDTGLLLILGANATQPGAPADLLGLLASAPAAHVRRLAPLSAEGAVELVARAAPAAPTWLLREVASGAGGVPWLLTELGRQLAADDAGTLVPGNVSTAPVTHAGRVAVRVRLAALSWTHREVASTLAVLGSTPPVGLRAALAGVEPASVVHAEHALRAVGLVEADGGGYVHAFVGAAVLADLDPAERERLHREAARLLSAAGAPAEEVAAHLMRCGPQADPEVSAALVSAATEAADGGRPVQVVDSLERALLEHAPDVDRGRLLALLATAAFDAGRDDVPPRLREALGVSLDAEARADVLTRLATAQVGDGVADPGLPGLLDEEGRPEDGREPPAAMRAASLDALMLLPGREDERFAHIASLRHGPGGDPADRHAAAVHAAWLMTEQGRSDAEGAAALVAEALADGRLLADVARRTAYHLAVRVLVMTDHHDAAEEAIAALRHEAAQRGSHGLAAGAGWYSAELALRTGRPLEAVRHAQGVLDGPARPTVMTRGAAQVLVRALSDCGRPDAARDVLNAHARWADLGEQSGTGLRFAAARLALAEGDYPTALEGAQEAGRLRLEQGRTNPSWTPWQSTAALALSHLGRRTEAVVLADDELRRAERFGAPVAIVVALHARAVAEQDNAARVALCERALDVASRTSARLDTVRVQLELGNTLIRQGTRAAARDALRPAFAVADAAGAAELAARAHRELVASGLRPRRAAIDGAGALTPRQRQVCGLAAGGSTNVEISQALFLTVKTVETHLSASFRLLGVERRAGLGAALALR